MCRRFVDAIFINRRLDRRDRRFQREQTRLRLARTDTPPSNPVRDEPRLGDALDGQPKLQPRLPAEERGRSGS